MSDAPAPDWRDNLMGLHNATSIAPLHLTMLQDQLSTVAPGSFEARKILEDEIARITKIANPGKSRVYFIEAVGKSRIKIGTTANIPLRLATLATASPFPLRLIGSIRGCREVERHWHFEFEDIRHRGEWFEATDWLRNTIQFAMLKEA